MSYAWLLPPLLYFIVVTSGYNNATITYVLNGDRIL